jgi:uncharacterized membrane protein YoaK (UPF0700 family)
MSKDETPHFTTEVVVSLLAYAAGAMDVFAFLKFQDVFTSAMTGNTALLGMALGQWHLLAASRSLTALLGFALGNIIATRIYDAGKTASPVQRRRRLLVIEVGCLAIVAILWGLLPHPVRHAPLFMLILLSAGSMGMQSVIARQIDLPGITTVVFTTTLTLIMMGVTRGLRRGGGGISVATRRQSLVMLIYLLGAAISGLCALHVPGLIALPPFVAAAVALAISGPYLAGRAA